MTEWLYPFFVHRNDEHALMISTLLEAIFLHGFQDHGVKVKGFSKFLVLNLCCWWTFEFSFLYLLNAHYLLDHYRKKITTNQYWYGYMSEILEATLNQSINQSFYFVMQVTIVAAMRLMWTYNWLIKCEMINKIISKITLWYLNSVQVNRMRFIDK